LTLNNRLRLTYEDIGWTQNKINGAYDKQERATLLQGRSSYEASMAITQREIRGKFLSFFCLLQVIP
jgi:hypothetical protein